VGQLYKQAGNGIVVDVFAAILKNLIEYQPKGKE
jgi:site-specific DNA-cytosine methylase